MNTKTKAKKERSDKLRNRAKVIKATLKNPLASQREIAKQQWVSDRTVWRVQSEMSQNVAKDDRILWICDKDLEIIKKWQEVIAKKLNNPKAVQKMRLWEISTALAESTRRYTLLKWDATDEQGWIKQVLINVNIE